MSTLPILYFGMLALITLRLDPAILRLALWLVSLVDDAFEPMMLVVCTFSICQIQLISLRIRRISDFVLDDLQHQLET